MRVGFELSCGDTADCRVWADIVRHYRTGTDTRARTYFHLSDYRNRWTYIHTVAYSGSQRVGRTDSCKLPEVDIIAYYRGRIDDKSLAMLYI